MLFEFRGKASEGAVAGLEMPTQARKQARGITATRDKWIKERDEGMTGKGRK